MATYETHLPITHLRREIAKATGCPIDSLPTYNRLYHRALDGQIPAEQIGRRWFVRRDDLPSTCRPEPG